MLQVQSLTKKFDEITAVDKVSFQINKGQTYGLIGESGSGKSTIGNMIIGLEEPTEGMIHFAEASLWNEKKKFIRPKVGKMQIVFQDPQSSLDARLTIKDIVTEPLRAMPKQVQKKKFKQAFLENLMERVGMNPDHLRRYPHEFSGGQRQRIAIARAIITNPDFLILDEPTSALDVSVQAQILNLLKNLQQEMALTYLFISHDMSVIRYMCDRLGVLYRGKLIEEGETEDLFNEPQEAYTQKLFSSLPTLAPEKG